MRKDLSLCLADHFGDRVVPVLTEQDVTHWSIDVRGSAQEIWARVVTAAVRRDQVPWLLRRAEGALGRSDGELTRAALDLMGDDPSVEPWMCELDRDQQREAIRDTDAAVLALVLTGEKGAGHEFLAHWKRYDFRQRRRTVEVAWPLRDILGMTNRLNAVCGRLARALELGEVVPSGGGDVRADPARWEELARVVTARIVRSTSPTKAHRAVVLIRHIVKRPCAEDVEAIEVYLQCLWARVARAMLDRGHPSRQCIVSIEVMTDDADLAEAVRRTATACTKPTDGLVVPELAGIGPVTRGDVHTWLRGSYREMLIERLLARRKEYAGTEDDLPALANAIVTNEGGEYEDIIKLFRG